MKFENLSIVGFWTGIVVGILILAVVKIVGVQSNPDHNGDITIIVYVEHSALQRCEEGKAFECAVEPGKRHIGVIVSLKKWKISPVRGVGTESVYRMELR